MLFYMDPGQKIGPGYIWQQQDEKIFIKLLTAVVICDMIAAVWFMDCCGDADAAAEAPPRLTSLSCLTYGEAR
jgi:hypothetical protein